MPEYYGAVARSSTTSDVFNAVAEARRREILDALIAGEKAVGAIVNDLSLSQPQVSKHLRVLSEVGLVSCRAEGRRRLYRLEPEHLRPFHDWLAKYEQAWNERTRSDGRLPQRTPTTRRAAVTPNRHGSSVIEFPNELEIVTTREFDAPLELVFDVLTKPEPVSKWFAPFTCEVTECSIDLRVGGNYHIVFVTEDGSECSFRGTYLEVEPPTRTVATWLFEGWPDADAVESVDLHETDGVTKLTMKLAFRDQAGRDHMTKSDGQEDSFNKMEDYLRTLLEQKETVSG
jgi:uncharacterized protein YndB with AHSA1/START domain/DNA-binding transcriptional ArsR family regulator